MSDRYYVRFQQQALQAPVPRPGGARNGGALPKVTLILGARQTGKSTLLNHCLPADPSVLRLNLQDRRERRRYETETGLLLRELEAAATIDTVVIDEVQKVPALLDDVQFLYDRDPRRYRFFLSGSSARQLKSRSANLLPGRVHMRLVSPVLQAEQRAATILPLPIPAASRFPARALDDCLILGSLPGRYHEDANAWRATLAAYVDLYVENEIRQENLVADMGAFGRFLRVAALESGQSVNHSRLAGAVGVALNTLRNFYRILEDTYVGIRLPPFGRSRKRILQAPRFLFFDLGVRHVLADLPLNAALLKLDAGHLFEQWVLTELHYRCVCLGAEYRCSTWRTATGAEVDGIVETPTEVLPVEAKWTAQPMPQDARHLETFLDLHREFAHRGYVVCRCPRPQQLTKRVTAIPWDQF